MLRMHFEDARWSALLLLEQAAYGITSAQRKFGISASRSRSDFAKPRRFVLCDGLADYFEDRCGS